MTEYIIPDGKKLRIAISGKSGCGNTTVSKMLSEKLGVRMINYTFRQLAEEKGLTLADILEKAKTDDSYDKFVDKRQVELAMEDSCVLGSRLAIWMLKKAELRVYLYADEQVRAERILDREGGNIQEIIDFTKMRDSQDTARYKKLYSIDNNDYKFCDMIIDTAKYNPEKIVDLIIEKLKEKKYVK